MLRVFIAVPQYKIMPIEKENELAEAFGFKNWRPLGFHPKFTESLGNFKKSRYGSGSELNILRGDSMIERARASLFGTWLEQWRKGNKFEYFMQIDEDIEFPRDAIPRLIESGKPFIGAAYAYKAKQGHKVGKSVCKYLPDQIVDERGVAKIKWLSGGFVLCHHEMLFEMMRKYPELRYDSITEFRGDQTNESYIFWLPLVHTITDGKLNGKKIFLSEDYAFAQRAIDAGFDNYEDTTIRLTHWDGLQSYRVGTEETELNQDGIPGWMNRSELEWLGKTARSMDSIVEVGSWKGRSTKVLLENCPGTVYSIDHFRGSKNATEELAQSYGEDGLYKEFMKNVGHFPNLKVMKMSSLEAAEKMNGQKFDLVFIDGDHSFNAVFADIQAWLPKCKKIIAGHDYQEVIYSVHQLLGNVNVVGSIWYKEL
jgi:hypothetical protein